MSKILDPKQPVEFTPSSESIRPEDERIVYLLKPPTVYTRLALKKAIAARGGQEGGPLDRLRAARAAVGRVYDDCDDPELTASRASVLALIDGVERAIWSAWHAASRWRKAEDAGAPEEERAELRAAYLAENRAMLQADAELVPIFTQLAEIDAAFAEARGAWAVYSELVGIESARKFLVGWHNIRAPFARGDVGVTEESLMAIPEHHLVAIGERVAQMMKPTEAEAGNSVSPSPTSSDTTTSPAASTQPESVH